MARDDDPVTRFANALLQNHRSHKYLNHKDVRKGDLSQFTPLRHSTRRLTSIVMKFSKYRGRELTALQKLCLHRYKTQEIFNLDHADKYESKKILRAYLELFDDLFFFGAIGNRVTCTLERGESRMRKYCLGYCDERTAKRSRITGRPKEIHAEIIIYSANKEPRRALIMSYLGILLHEMCHAFFRIWACVDEDCTGSHKSTGATGHGLDFIDMAHAVREAASDREWLGLNLPMNLTHSLASELVSKRLEPPSQKELSDRWPGLTLVYLKRCMQHYKENSIPSYSDSDSDSDWEDAYAIQWM